MADRETIINAIEKAKKQSEECAQDPRPPYDRWFCADGEKDGSQIKRPQKTFWDSLSEADLMEPMHHFEE